MNYEGGLTDRQTDRPTNRQTDIVNYRRSCRPQKVGQNGEKIGKHGHIWAKIDLAKTGKFTNNVERLEI